jgi:carbon monoxide dehydrogenase subunit G
VELNNEFEVERPIDEAWQVLTDVERIAPCLPGAQLEEIEGDEYRGVVKVKVGPITAQYKGKATFVEKDDAAKKAVLKAEGRDSRGQGNASALITAQLTEAGSGRTKVVVNTDLTVTGKVAQFGRGVMADVSERLLGQFVSNLETKVLGNDDAAAKTADASSAGSTGLAGAASAGSAGAAAGGASAPASPGAAATATTSAPAPGSTGPTATAPTTASTSGSPASSSAPGSATAANNGTPGVRRVTSSEPVEPVNLLEATGAPLVKRLAPVLGVVFVLWVLARMRRRHH